MRTVVAAAVACLSIVGLSVAQDVKAAIKTDISIPAGELGAALQILSEERRIHIIFVNEDVSRLSTQGASGALTNDELLKQLLNGTGLTYQYIDNETISVLPMPSAPVARPTTGVSNSSFSASDGSVYGRQADNGPKRFWQRFGFSQGETSSLSNNGAPSGPSSEAQNGGSESPSTLEEVIVTAQKRTERLRDVPISISVLSGEHLDKSTAQGVAEMLGGVPGVATTLSFQGGGTQVAVRGVAAAGAQFYGSSPIAYYLDTVPFGFVKSALAPDSNAYDLQRVEVLRGPQGTLYGASALNGVVRILTQDADLDQLEFKARTSASTTDAGGENFRGDMAVNVPLIVGKLAARAVVGYEDVSGWIDRPNDTDANDAELRNLRLKVNAQPLDDLSIGLSAWLSRSDFGAPSTGDKRNLHSSLRDESITTDYDAFGLKIGYAPAAFSITSMTSYLEYENISSLDLLPYVAAPLVLPTHLNSEVFTQEIVLQSMSEGVWRWSIGGIYRDARDRLWQNIAGVYPAPTDFSDDSESFAVFGEVSRLFLDGRVELTVGLRHFEDDVTQSENVRHTGDPSESLYRASSTFEADSPRVVVTWHSSDALTLYGSYAKGFRSGFNQNANAVVNAPNFPPLDADTLKNYELGAKGAVLDGRLSFDAAVYYIDWQDVQQPVTIDINGVPTSVLINGESASGMGVDFALTTQPFDGLELGINLGWNDLAVDADVFSSGAVLFDKGDRLNSSPEYTAGALANYGFALGGLEARFTASANYTSKQATRTIIGERQAVETADPILIARTAFSIETPSRWTATLFVDNINNERGTPVRPLALGVPEWAQRVRPRTTGVQLEYRF
jgi:iron complex outermembrane recepter protein